MAQNHGWIGGAWHKDPLRFGYSDTVNRAFSDTNLAGGSSVFADNDVPAGEIWIITNITVIYVGTIAGVGMRPRIYDGSASYDLWESNPTASNRAEGRSGWWILIPGHSLRVFVTGATAGDDAYCYATGFRMDSDQ